MWHVGIDVHREFVVMAAVKDDGEVMDPVRISCRETEAILEAVRRLGRFRAVIEASGTYRWLYERINQIPLAYIPPEPYQQLRDLTRCRARLGRNQAAVKIRLRALLARRNRAAPFRVPFGPRGLAWFSKQDSDEGNPRGRGAEELLHASAKAIQRQNRAGGRGTKTGGDLLEAAAPLAT